MEVKAKLKHLRISPRKVRLVVDVVRGMNVDKALDQLRFLNKKAAKSIEKLLNSCVANAIDRYETEKNNLYIKEIKVDEGATLKRWMPRAQGRATPIRKRTSHVIINLSEIKESAKKKTKKQDIEAPIKLDEILKKDNKIIDKKSKEEKKQEKENGNEIVEHRDERRFKTEKASRKGFVGKIFRRKSG